ncbi:PA2169 family four-helix-bundle protein [Alteromonas pelagimontana]|uniref:PA2169 family four-helix-bundle protein n=1 Tax=Alteromonas pelagimontana TaxID=1858656 RepID=A0A6M4MJP3_9ALTE|nr:PA2169 family four-helix-bundle protein [Alteromonas pelagimontana]QJR82306.1 PA2169 family four-helix-bundle protein [Alteromonas pelagimontana]
MSNQTPQVDKVTDIIKVMNGGIEFYQDGIEKVSQQNLKAMFTRMITEKQEAIAALQPYAVSEQGDAETDSDWTVDVRNMYTNLLGALSSNKDHTYVDQLEEVEDKVLEAIDDALEENQPANCATELRRVRVRMQQCHDEMKSLQDATA